jgi:hypothetical protein
MREIPDAVRQRVRETAGDRCGYCLSPHGTQIIGLTSIGRATVAALQLNNELAVEVRRNWVLAGWHPPQINEQR